MFGISSAGKEGIAKIVEEIFDRIALQYIGDIPQLRHKKILILSSQPNYGLANLFVQAMDNKDPNYIESDALKSMLSSSYGYIESIKNRTKSSLTETLDGLVKEAKLQNREVTKEEMENAIQIEMTKAKSQLATTIETETTKVRNVGSAMSISRVASSLGDKDPTVYFVVVRDGYTCNECIRLHLMPDGITPKLWKLSQLKQGYHKRSEDFPSVSGLHPHCRCFLSYITKDYGFDEKGHMKYKDKGYNAFKDQSEQEIEE